MRAVIVVIVFLFFTCLCYNQSAISNDESEIKNMDALYFDTTSGQIKATGSGGTRDVNLQQDGIQAPSVPVQPVYTAPAAPVGPTQAQLNPLLASLSSLDTILANKNSQSRGEYNRAIKGYNEQDAIDRRNYDENTVQNEQALTAGNQAALLNAANASSGLRGVLSGLGALAGSGVDVVQRLVGLAANKDTGDVRQNFETNATNLNNAWSQAEQEQRQRRQDARATLDNSLQNNKANVLTSRQGIYEQLANLYGPDLAQGGEYASKAAALAAPIANTTRATVAPYAKASSSFSPGALKSYLAGTQNLEVDTSGGGGKSATPINSPLFSNDRRKDQLAGVA